MFGSKFGLRNNNDLKSWTGGGGGSSLGGGGGLTVFPFRKECGTIKRLRTSDHQF